MDDPLSSGPGSKFRVAICGGGLGGLVLAVTIGKYDPCIPIDLYEAHDSIDTPGVGVTVWRQTQDVMSDLGLFDDFKRIIPHDPESSPSPRVRRSDIPEGGYLWYWRGHRKGPLTLHRQRILAILEKYLPASCTVHLKKRLVNYVKLEQDAYSTSSIRLEFADGTIAATDVLIGADGIRSAVRKTMFEAASEDDRKDEADMSQYVDATFTGMTVYRSLVSTKPLAEEDPNNRSLKEMTIYTGRGRYMVAYPLAEGTLINIVAMVCDPSLADTHYEGRWVTDATQEEVVGYFDDFEPDARSVIKLCEKPSKWALHVVKPLPFCVRNRVALIGDACHAMTTHFAAGAVQAIDDAFILGRLLSHPLTSLSRVQDALRIYEDVRFPFASAVAGYSLSTGWMYSFMAPGYYDGTRRGDDVDDEGIGAYERDGMETMKQEILRRWDFMSDSRSAPQVWEEEAEARLRALVDS